MKWAILEGKRKYVNVEYDTKGEAELELASLLRPYPKKHEWRQRLHVGPAPTKTKWQQLGRGEAMKKQDDKPKPLADTVFKTLFAQPDAARALYTTFVYPKPVCGWVPMVCEITRRVQAAQKVGK